MTEAVRVELIQFLMFLVVLIIFFFFLYRAGGFKVSVEVSFREKGEQEDLGKSDRKVAGTRTGELQVKERVREYIHNAEMGAVKDRFENKDVREEVIYRGTDKLERGSEVYEEGTKKEREGAGGISEGLELGFKGSWNRNNGAGE